MATTAELGFGENRRINFREELAKGFQLFRDNIDTRIFLFGGYNHFAHIDSELRFLTGLDLFSEVSGFVDNDKSKQGTKCKELPIIAPEELRENDFVILTGSPVHIEMYRQLSQLGYIHRYHFILNWDLEMICKRFAYTQTRGFQNTHNGERCFIIGNGPSLTIDDLNCIKKNGIPSFVSNNFFKLFDSTDFRPEYYVITDILNLDKHDLVFEETTKACFIEITYRNAPINMDKVYFFEQSMWANYSFFSYKALFSDDIAFTYESGSVSYTMMQIAVNMGFKEIYLLGMDHNFPLLITHDGRLTRNSGKTHHFYKNTNPSQVCYTKDLFEAGCAYAKEYCKIKGAAIYNATRGGKLEIFDRVDFDNLFDKRGAQ